MPAPFAFLKPEDLSPEQTRQLIDLALELKRDPLRNELAGRTLVMMFFNPSLRTRVSFDVAMRQLGGHAVTLEVGGNSWTIEYRDDVVMDGANVEHIREAAPVLSRYGDAIAIRAFPKYDRPWSENRAEPIHEGFARHATVPIINMESSLHHPCQGLADIMTIREKIGEPIRQPIAITWGWHINPLPMAVTNSILLEAAKAGMDIRLAHPPGWELDDEVMASARQLSGATGGALNVVHSMDEAVAGARVVYTKSWGSIRNYGNPDQERAEALQHRDRWQLTMDHIKSMNNGIHLHCLPVRRGVEVMPEVLDSPHSVVIDEAENRLHVQKALLAQILRREG